MDDKCLVTAIICALIAACLGFADTAGAQPGTVLDHQKISDIEGGSGGLLTSRLFGISGTAIGDLDGDGVTDVAVGAHHNVEDIDTGAVWILFLNVDGTVKDSQRIRNGEGGFTAILDEDDGFGRAVTCLDDLDGDGVNDIAVGAENDDDGGENRGAIWILFLNADGTAKAHQKISAVEGNFTGSLHDRDYFGISAACLGDLDGDGVSDILVGAAGDDDGGESKGAVWVLFLNADGTTKSHQKISDTQGSFDGILATGDTFGFSVASLGDLGSDGAATIAVGAWADDDGGPERGAVWLLFLNPDGTVSGHQKISDAHGNFAGILEDGDRFGASVGSLGDVNGDGVTDIVVGAHMDDDGGDNRGTVWLLFLDPNGMVTAYQKISNTEGGFTGQLHDHDSFGISTAFLGDLNGDGMGDLAVGAFCDDDGDVNKGAVWILFLETRINLIEIVGPYINNAIIAKTEAMEAIDTALNNEQSALRVLKRLLNGGNLDDQQQVDVRKAKAEILSAILREKAAQHIVRMSLKKLQDAWLLLTEEPGWPDGSAEPDDFNEELEELKRADINGDGVVDGADFANLTQYWLKKYDPEE